MGLITPEIRALEGRRRVYTAPEPMGAAAARYFAQAVGDENPLYVDAAFATAHGLRGVTMPPTLICETNQYTNLKADHDGFAGHSWDIHLPHCRLVRGGNSYVFHRRVRPEDIVTATWTVERLTDKVNQAGQDMLVIESRATYTNQDGDLLTENEETIIYVALGSADER